MRRLTYFLGLGHEQRTFNSLASLHQCQQRRNVLLTDQSRFTHWSVTFYSLTSHVLLIDQSRIIHWPITFYAKTSHVLLTDQSRFTHWPITSYSLMNQTSVRSVGTVQSEQVAVWRRLCRGITHESNEHCKGAVCAHTHTPKPTPIHIDTRTHAHARTHTHTHILFGNISLLVCRLCDKTSRR